MNAQERFDKILIAWARRVQDEVTALIGKPFTLGEPQTAPGDKETLFSDLGGKQVLAHVRIEGDVQGNGCLVVSLQDAIFIGGALIMLPESELDAVVAEQQYSEELQDSYGEVANIICGAATVTFGEQYPETVRLLRTEQEVVLPAKVEVESDQPITDEPYYQLSVPMTLDGKALGHLNLVLPAVPFGLAEAATKEASTPEPESESANKGFRASADAAEPGGVCEREGDTRDAEEVGVLEHPEYGVEGERAAARTATCKRDPDASTAGMERGDGTGAQKTARLQDQALPGTDMLIITDDEIESGRIADVLASKGYGCRILHFKDPVHAVLNAGIQMVFLVMREVSEQGFGVAIKISSSGLPIPLVAAGPAWTRTMVLKAVKYGACDILITPSSSKDVVEKLANNLVKKAA